MTRSNFCLGAAVAALALPLIGTPVLAQEGPGSQQSYPTAPTPARRPPPPPRNSDSVDNLIVAQNQEAARAEQRRQAELANRNELQVALAEDVAAGRLTQAQADTLYDNVVTDVAAVYGRIGLRGDRVLEGVNGGLQIAMDRIGNEFRLDANDPNFSRGAAEGLVDFVDAGLQVRQEMIREIGPGVGELISVIGNMEQQRVDFMKATGVAPPLYIQNSQNEATRTRRIGEALPSRLDQEDFTISKGRTTLDVDREKIVEKVTPKIEAFRKKMTDQYGPDISKWPKAPPPAPPPARAPGPRLNNDGTYGTPLPWESQPASLPPTTTPATRPPGGTSATGTSSTRTASRGTIPPADPYAGLRVPPPAGSTGATAPAGTTSPTPGPAPQQGSAASSATRSASSSANPATTQPKAPPKPSLNVPKTNIPTNTRTGENNANSTDLGISATTRPANQRTPVQSAASGAASAGAAGKPAKAPAKGSSAGASGSASSFTDATRVEAQSGDTAYDPQKRGADRPKSRNTMRVAAGFRGTGFIEVDMDEAIRQATRKPAPPPKPLTQAERNAINNVLRGLPKNPDGSIDVKAGYNALIKSVPEALKNLFAPKPAGNATRSGAATNAAAASAAQRIPTTVAQQRAPEPFVQPRQPGGPDYPLAPSRASRRAQQGAAQGQWTPGDSFGAAGAAATAAASAQPPDVVDLAIERIEAESNAAMEAWRRRADEVYYDENGVIHSVPRDRPENTYRRAPTPLRPVDDSAWGRFERGEGSLSILDLEPIYAGWNPDTAPVGLGGSRGPSSAGSVGPSSAGNSLRMDWNLPPSGYLSTELEAMRANGSLFGIGAGMGVPTNWGGLELASGPIRVSGNQQPPFGSREQVLRDTSFGGGFNPNDPFGDNSVWRSRPLAETAPDLARQLYGPLWSDRPFQVRTGAAAREGAFSGNQLVGTLFNEAQLTELRVNGLGGLDRLLAQPFNVLLTWGAGAFDLDLHLTGPLAASADRFHIFFAARGSQTVAPFAELIRDCVCNSGSEVILTAQLVRGGVYRISVFNFGDQSASSLNLANLSNATIQIVRGGQAVAAGNGTTIVGGRVIYTGTAPRDLPGNTWVAVEIDARNGKIVAPNTIVQSSNSSTVR